MPYPRQCPAPGNRDDASRQEKMTVVARYPDSTKTSLEQRLRARARDRWPQIASLHIRHRGNFSYVDATLTDGSTLKLCRLRYVGSASQWQFAIYRASPDDYAESVFFTGLPVGTCQDALDTACGLYLNDPTAWTRPPTNLQARPLSLPGPGPGGLVLDRLGQRPAQHLRALLGHVPADHLGVGLVVPRGQPGPGAQLPGLAEPGDVADLGADHRGQHRADPVQLPHRGVSRIGGQHGRGLVPEPGDLAVQHPDQGAQRGHLPGIGGWQDQLVQPQPAAAAEDIRVRDRDTELGQYRVHLVLAAGPLLHQLVPVCRGPDYAGQPGKVQAAGGGCCGTLGIIRGACQLSCSRKASSLSGGR